MIWSVSTSARGQRQDLAADLLERLHQFRLHVADIDEVARDRRRRRHLRADEVRAAARPLPPLEVAVRGRGAALARQQDVRVHAQAHRAAGVAPLEARVDEDLVEALLLRLRLHQARARHHHRAAPCVATCLPAHDLRPPRAGPRCAPFVQEPRNTRSSAMSSIAVPGLQVHVRQRALGQLARARRRRSSSGSGTRPVTGTLCAGVVPHVTHGSMSSPSQLDRRVERRALVRRQRAPRLERPLPVRALRRERPALRRRRTSCRPARPGPRARRPRSTCCRPSSGLPSRASRMTSPRYSMTWPMPPATPILRMIARITSFAVTPSCSAPFTSTDIVFGVACGSVCVASTCSTSDVPMPNASAPNAPCVEVWLSPQTIVMPGCVSPCSGPMTCTMPCRTVVHAEVRHAELLGSSRAASSTCCDRERVRPRLVAVERRHVVVDRRQREVGPAHLAPGQPQRLERLRRRHFVHEVQVDVQQVGLARPRAARGARPRSSRTVSSSLLVPAWPMLVAARRHSHRGARTRGSVTGRRTRHATACPPASLGPESACRSR